MGTTNEKTIARSAQAKFKPDSIAGGCRVTGGESEAVGNQQERDYRTNSSESSIFSAGTAVTGGMLDHLIDEYCDQVAAKEDEIQRINDEIKRLRSRVQEFKALREELKKQTEDS
ncbi:hypothetical protein NIES4103_27530 [Nostoc sp. NIES-4103]|nr:hypothetical protein NIES4103_27530 [Nostoc sp. NIES-4103]